ncbi:hypothetical protein PAGU2595_001770 [Lysobacter xanthus]
MLRTCLCLLMLVACADAAARDVRLSGAESGGADVPVPARVESRKPAAARDTAPAQDGRVRPSVHGDVGTTRTRWHSFLPGMFR